VLLLLRRCLGVYSGDGGYFTHFFVVVDGNGDWFVAFEEDFFLRQNSVVAFFFESSLTTTQSDRKCRLFAYTRDFWRSPPS
jgi:hypothetical protein